MEKEGVGEEPQEPGPDCRRADGHMDDAAEAALQTWIDLVAELVVAAVQEEMRNGQG
ncbi:MAG: hypothetical protein M0C28_48435 [Candidatus Moduliflexus flocculans]|nr:hypothetical protein [Candidatus Moduliflexus flocculans]